MLLRRSGMRHSKDASKVPSKRSIRKLHVKEYLEVSTVTFYLLSTDDEVSRQRFACKLASDYCYSQLRAHILVPNQKYLEELEEMLWEHPAGRFVPHVVLAGRSDSCLVTLNTESQFEGTGDVLINTTSSVPDMASKFHKTCEIVLTTERPRAREHYRQYRSLNYELFHELHDEDTDFVSPPTQPPPEET